MPDREMAESVAAGFSAWASWRTADPPEVRSQSTGAIRRAKAKRNGQCPPGVDPETGEVRA